VLRLLSEGGYFWNLWTLAYLNFTGRLNDRPDVPREVV